MAGPTQHSPRENRRTVDIYFDHNATTPLDPAVHAAMEPFFMQTWGNPSSVHRLGRQARAALDHARYSMAASWKCKPSEVVFTSGGTESNNAALVGAVRALLARGRHVIASSVEHPAVLGALKHLERFDRIEVAWLPVDPEGRVAPDDVARAMRPDTILVSVMAANNEIGTLQPVAEIGTLCRARGVVFHTDAVQVFGKEAFRDIHQFNADLVSVCAHKFHGPKGAGALFVRSPFQPVPFHMGGAQENEHRGGTENLPAIVGHVEAFRRFVLEPVFPAERLRCLTERLAARLTDIPGVVRRGPVDRRLANTVAFTVDGCDSIALLAGLDLEGVCASSGSACSAGSLEPSHVLRAIGVPDTLANALVRFSLGRHSTEAEVDHVATLFPRVVDRIRRASSRRPGP